MARLLAAALFAAAVVATWLAWIAYKVLCEEGCSGRPWPLVAQLIAAGCGLSLAAAAVLARGRTARRLMVAAAVVYAAWALLLIAATHERSPSRFSASSTSARAAGSPWISR